MAHTFQSSLLQGHHSYNPAERKISYTQVYHQGHRVCQHTFLFIHIIGRKRVKNIKASPAFSKQDQCQEYTAHGNTGSRPKHQLPLQQVKDVTQYILNYTGKKQHTCSHILYMHYKSHLTCIYIYIYTVHACTTEANAMVLPGRVPEYKSSDIQLLPSSTTKHKVWELYQQAASVESMHPVSYSTLRPSGNSLFLMWS